jgi:hypothetical protein
MKEQYNEQFKIILTKTVNGQTFTLELHAIPNEDYSEVSGYDYIISGPNWLSGYLKAQGYNEMAIFEYFDQCTMQDVNDAWAAHYERSLNA